MANERVIPSDPQRREELIKKRAQDQRAQDQRAQDHRKQ
jgi:hypothetical protein